MELWDILDRNRKKTGKFVERGKSMNYGEYHLVVFALVRNIDGQFLISKRTPNKSFPNRWEIPGGSAIVGDDSLTAILREVKEELNVDLKNKNGHLLKSFRYESGFSYFADVWLFEHNVDMTEVRCQADEVSEAKLVTKEELYQLIENGSFIKSDLILSCLELI